jgi:hypothetical protein
MFAQNLAVAAIVGACALYAVWRLMPSMARRAVATAALRLPLPGWLAAPLQRTAQATDACGCAGCDSTVAKPGAAQPLTFHPRRRR